MIKLLKIVKVQFGCTLYNNSVSYFVLDFAILFYIKTIICITSFTAHIWTTIILNREMNCALYV